MAAEDRGDQTTGVVVVIAEENAFRSHDTHRRRFFVDAGNGEGEDTSDTQLALDPDIATMLVDECKVSGKRSHDRNSERTAGAFDADLLMFQ